MTARRLWVALLVALLAAVLVGPGVVGAVEPRTTRFITIPAGAFHAYSDDMDYTNWGQYLFTNTGSGRLEAPLFFETPTVTINSITLYALDNNAGGDICINLHRTTPWNGDTQWMGQACSTGASATDPRIFTNSTTFDYRIVGAAYGPYLNLTLPGSYSDGYAFYGVRINYSY